MNFSYPLLLIVLIFTIKPSFANSTVLSVGYNCIDYIMETNTDFDESDEKEAQSFKSLPGGQAATVAYTLKGLGMNSFYFGKFGNDNNAEVIKKSLVDYGVNIDLCIIEESPNQTAFIDVDIRTGEKKIIGYKHSSLSLNEVELNKNILQKFHYIFIDGHEPHFSLKLVYAAKQLKIPIIADIEHFSLETKQLISYIDYLIVPEKVAISATNTKDLKRAISILQKMGPKEVVITLGKNGCLGIDSKKRIFFTKAYEDIKVVDSTGAGDNFHAAFIYALYKGLDFKDILSFSNYLGAVSCEFQGARIPSQKLNSIFNEWQLIKKN